jgi:universal stress protein A
MKVEKILVPMDFSDHSKRALEQAVSLAKTFGASIDLLHSYRINYSGVMPYGADFPAAVYEDIRKHASSEMDKAQADVSDAGVSCQMHLSQEEPSHAIANAAEELGSDLIVMGTHGRTGLAHIALGSVAERTVRAAPCPVLTINQN